MPFPSTICGGAKAGRLDEVVAASQALRVSVGSSSLDRRWAKAGMSRSATARPANLRLTMPSTILRRCSLAPPAASAASSNDCWRPTRATSGPASRSTLTSGMVGEAPSATRFRLLAMRPTLRAHFMDGVEQNQVLHVAVLLEQGRSERHASIDLLGRSRRRARRGGSTVGRLDQTLASQFVEESSDGSDDLFAWRLVALLKHLVDPRFVSALLDAVPYLRACVPQAVIAAGREVDDDHFSLDRLVHYVWALHPKPPGHTIPSPL